MIVAWNAFGAGNVLEISGAAKCHAPGERFDLLAEYFLPRRLAVRGEGAIWQGGTAGVEFGIIDKHVSGAFLKINAYFVTGFDKPKPATIGSFG